MTYKFVVTKRHRKPDSGEYWHGETLSEHLNLTEYQTILPTVLNYLPERGRILEAGCGLGRWLMYLREQGYNIQGLDISEEALKKIHDYDSATQIILSDVTRTAYASQTFAAIICLGVIEHFEDGPQVALAELRRVLDNEGVLLVSVPYNSALRKLVYHPLVTNLKKLVRRMQGHQLGFAEYRFGRKEFVNILKEAEFDVISVIPDDFRWPKSMGLCADWSFILGRRGKKWELNTIGRLVQRFLGLFSPWVYCAGIFCVATKSGMQQ